MDKLARTSQVDIHHEAASGTARVGRFLRSLGRFVAQFGGLCMAMCVGGSILTFAFFAGAALIGSANLDRQSPVLPILVLAFNMAIAMAAWMLVWHHGRRHILEMAGATIATGLLVAGGVWLGLISQSSPGGWPSAFRLLCGPECLVMFALMLLHVDHYTGKARHPAHAM